MTVYFTKKWQTEGGRKKFVTEICTKTLYNYIDKGLFLNISNKDLFIKKQGRKKVIKRLSCGILLCTQRVSLQAPFLYNMFCGLFPQVLKI